MKTQLSVAALTLLLCGGTFAQQEEALGTAKIQSGMVPPSSLGAPAKLKKYNVTIHRFDPKQGLASGEDFILPVDSPDEEHAISSTLANAVSFTKKVQGSEVLAVAFCCTGIEEGK